MATHVLDDAYFMVNTVDLSAYIRSITFPLEQALVNATCMGDTYDEFLFGFKSGTFTIRFAQDFAAAKVDATLWAIHDGGAAVAYIFKPDGDTTAVTNPKFTGNVILVSYQVVDGAAGALAEITANFNTSGTVNRATSD